MTILHTLTFVIPVFAIAFLGSMLHYLEGLPDKKETKAATNQNNDTGKSHEIDYRS
jgi:hypothetical protein